MRTTLNLNPELARTAKRVASERGVTLTALIEEGLQGVLTDRRRTKAFRLNLPVIRGRRAPTVDLADRDRLYELLDQPD